MSAETFGRLESDSHVEENLECREIVRKIIDFGATQRQLLFIVRLIALELENFDHGREIIGAVDSFNENILITNVVEK